MSILEKLKDLVQALETEGKSPMPTENVEEDVHPEEQPLEVLEESVITTESEDLEQEPEQIEENTPEIEEDAVEEFPDYLECTLEESVVLSNKLSELRSAKVNLGDLVSLFEERKEKLLSRITSNKKELLAHIESLRLEYGVPREGYQVQLPASPDDKVSFSKKD